MTKTMSVDVEQMTVTKPPKKRTRQKHQSFYEVVACPRLDVVVYDVFHENTHVEDGLLDVLKTNTFCNVVVYVTCPS